MKVYLLDCLFSILCKFHLVYQLLNPDGFAQNGKWVIVLQIGLVVQGFHLEELLESPVH